ncbi:MAG: glycine cleavage system protein H [Candidatus Anammoxibacter sp.]
MPKSQSKLNIDMQSLKFTPTHEWLYVEGNTVVIGVTEIVTNRLGPIVHIDIPMVGDEVLTIVPFCEIEAVDDTFDVNSPIEGDVVEINEKLMNSLDILPADPYKKGWLIKLIAADINSLDLDSLMSKEEYESKCEIELNKRKRRSTTKTEKLECKPKAKLTPKKKTGKLKEKTTNS